jgi:hypothetical protein
MQHSDLGTSAALFAAQTTDDGRPKCFPGTRLSMSLDRNA